MPWGPLRGNTLSFYWTRVKGCASRIYLSEFIAYWFVPMLWMCVRYDFAGKTILPHLAVCQPQHIQRSQAHAKLFVQWTSAVKHSMRRHHLTNWTLINTWAVLKRFLLDTTPKPPKLWFLVFAWEMTEATLHLPYAICPWNLLHSSAQPGETTPTVTMCEALQNDTGCPNFEWTHPKQLQYI